MKKMENNCQEILLLEQELTRLEQSLERTYAEAGKALLEVAEIENQKANQIVDEIITLRRKLNTLKIKEEE